MRHRLAPLSLPATAARGVSLIEALVALLVMSLGMMALVGVQATLRGNSDLSRQRAEASRIASEQIESLRFFNTLAPVGGQVNPSWSEIEAATTDEYTLPGSTSNTTYSVTRKVTALEAPRRLVVQVDVSWKDRNDVSQVVYLDSVIAGVEPRLSSLLMVPATTPAFARRSMRHATIPVDSKDLGNGGSAFKPPNGDGLVWVFNNTTGLITSVCTGVGTVTASLTSTLLDAASCTAVNARLLAGSVRYNFRGGLTDLADGTSAFKPLNGGTAAWRIGNSVQRVVSVCTVNASTATADLTAADLSSCTAVSAPLVSPLTGSENLTSADALNPRYPALSVRVEYIKTTPERGILSGTKPTCYVSYPTSALEAALQTESPYYCIIYPADASGWGGRFNVTMRSYSAPTDTADTNDGQFKVCRYTTADTDATANSDHPQIYCITNSSLASNSLCPDTRVKANLANQNFLVIPSGKTCPTDTAVDAASGHLVNANTLQHQP